MTTKGHVYLIGAGPGDPDLLTVKALRLLRAADVVVHDRLVSKDILDLVPAGTRLIPVGKAPRSHPVPQEAINALLVALAAEGLTVARVKGGDPFIFGRGSEEALTLAAAGIGCTVVPGITAAQGCAAAAGVPLTHRGLATGVRYVTGHCRADMPLDLDWQGLADPDTTLVVYMGAANIGQIARELQRGGLDGSMPVLAINNGTTPKERRVSATLATVESMTLRADFGGPVLFIIGRVAGLNAHDAACAIPAFAGAAMVLEAAAIA